MVLPRGVLQALAGDPAQPAIARATAVERLAERADSGQLLTIRRLLKDPGPMVRAAAVAYLDGADLRKVFEPGSGHPSFHPAGRYLITNMLIKALPKIIKKIE